MAHELKRKLDYSDLVVTPDDGRRYEIVEGDLFVTPSPRPVHQRILGRLYVLLREYVMDRSMGEVFFAPLDLILTQHDVFVPDLLVVSDPVHVTERGVEGPPLLVVEVSSPSTGKLDRVLKARRYAELGVRHYWIVDPQDQRFECYRLAAGAFQAVVSAEGDAVVMHPDWDGLELDLAALWR